MFLYRGAMAQHLGYACFSVNHCCDLGHENQKGVHMSDSEKVGAYILFVVSFLGTFAFLITSMPTSLAHPQAVRNATTTDYFEAIDITSFAETWSYRMNETGGKIIKYWTVYGLKDMYSVEIEIDDEWFGGHNIDFVYSKANDTGNPMHPSLFIKHWYAVNLFDVYAHGMEWINGEGSNKGDVLQGSELNTDYAEGHAEYMIQCKHFNMRGYFGYNETEYDNPVEAWNHHDLWVFLGINFDQIATSYNAWGLISMILFWKAPDIDPLFNVILSIPFWAIIVYIIIKVISLLLPFVG